MEGGTLEAQAKRAASWSWLCVRGGRGDEDRRVTWTCEHPGAALYDTRHSDQERESLHVARGLGCPQVTPICSCYVPIYNASLYAHLSLLWNHFASRIGYKSSPQRLTSYLASVTFPSVSSVRQLKCLIPNKCNPRAQPRPGQDQPWVIVIPIRLRGIQKKLTCQPGYWGHRAPTSWTVEMAAKAKEPARRAAKQQPAAAFPLLQAKHPETTTIPSSPHTASTPRGLPRRVTNRSGSPRDTGPSGSFAPWRTRPGRHWTSRDGRGEDDLQKARVVVAVEAARRASSR